MHCCSWTIINLLCTHRFNTFNNLDVDVIVAGKGVVLAYKKTLLTFAYTCVSAGPSLSGSPLRMMVSEPESRGGISTDTPVASRISCRVLPFGPMMYLC